MPFQTPPDLVGLKPTALITRVILTQCNFRVNISLHPKLYEFWQGGNEFMSPTIRDIAKRAGVSHPVVSAILRGSNKNVRYSKETAERVLEIARQLGYRPSRIAKGLVMRQTLTVGVCFTSELRTIFSYPSTSIMITSIGDVLSQHDYGILFKPNPVKGDYLPDPSLFHPNEVDGVLLVGPVRLDDKGLKRWQKISLPFVLLSTPPKGSEKINSVDLDNFAAGYDSACYLLQKGYRRIGLVMPAFTYTCHEERLKGFKKALLEFGATFRKDWVWTVGWRLEEGYAFAQQFAQQLGRPEGLVMFAELPTIGFLKGLQELGWRIPEDLAIVAMEAPSYSLAAFSGIAVTETPYAQIGATGAEALLKLIKGEVQPTICIRLPLQIRENVLEMK